MEYFDLDDGTSIAIGDVQVALLNGTTGNDTIQGYVSSDDTLVGAGGNDLLSGRSGSDTYLFDPGDGHDTINEEGDDSGSAVDRILFGAGIDAADVSFSRSGNSLIVTLDGTTDQITVQDGLWSTINNAGLARDRVEYFDFNDGTRVAFADVELALLTGGMTTTPSWATRRTIPSPAQTEMTP